MAKSEAMAEVVARLDQLIGSLTARPGDGQVLAELNTIRAIIDPRPIKVTVRFCADPQYDIDEDVELEFGSKLERDIFMDGVDCGSGWSDYDVKEDAPAPAEPDEDWQD